MGRSGPLTLPNLSRLGLGKAAEESTGTFPVGLDKNADIIGAYGYASELSSGKDTPSGHWEIAGVPVLFDWGYFSDVENSFPQELLDKLVKRANLPGYLGNCHSSGTVILDQLGEEHMKTGKPISTPLLTPYSRLPATKRPLVWIVCMSCAKLPVKS